MSPSGASGPLASLAGWAGGRRPLAVAAVPEGWLLDLSGLGLDGRWVTISLREPGSGAAAGVLMSLVSGSPDASPTRSLLEEVACGGGAFAWTGRLPRDVHALRLARLSADAAPERIAIRPRSRAALLLLGLLRAPRLAGRALGWRILGKRVRAQTLLDRALRHRARTGYQAWIRRHDTLGEADRDRMRAAAAFWADPPRISILMPVHDPDPRVLEATLASVRAQLYPHWELCVVDDASTDARIPALLRRHAAEEPRIRLQRRAENGHIARASNDALALATGAFAAFLDHDDVLAEAALFEVARAIRAEPDLVLIYTDEDKVDAAGHRFEPHFKSGFDRELLYGQNYINHLTVVRTEALRDLGGLRPGFEGSQDHDLLLRLTKGLDRARIRHIPKVLYHWRAAPGSGTFSDRALARAEAARVAALAEAVAGTGARAVRGPLGFNRLIRPLPRPAPRVSVVIPTRDRADLLRVTLDGLLRATDYPEIEIVVVDNGSREAATAALFADHAGDPRMRVVPAPGPFNFSDLSNRGAAAASGPMLLFLNNDIEVTEPGWLAEMVAIACEPDVGAVGAKLVYPDGSLQHGGVILGIGGVAGHSHLGLPGEAPGYFARMQLTQEASAVTAACLAMRAEVFRAVGGFDAQALAVAFNDVDLCLRVRRAGYRIVWTPHARLVHHESKSRGAEDTPEKRARFAAEVRVMVERWGPELRADPYYNANLSRRTGHYRL